MKQAQALGLPSSAPEACGVGGKEKTESEWSSKLRCRAKLNYILIDTENAALCSFLPSPTWPTDSYTLQSGSKSLIRNVPTSPWWQKNSSSEPTLNKLCFWKNRSDKTFSFHQIPEHSRKNTVQRHYSKTLKGEQCPAASNLTYNTIHLQQAPFPDHCSM